MGKLADPEFSSPSKQDKAQEMRTIVKPEFKPQCCQKKINKVRNEESFWKRENPRYHRGN
jgi:hypothetical protein